MAANQRQQTRTAPGFWTGTTLPVVLLLAAMVVGMAALLPLVQTSGSTTTAGRIRQLEQERADWQAQLREQELRVAELGSLARIEEEARGRLKMVPPQEVHYIRVDAPAPAPHRLPSRFLPEQKESTAAGTSLWQDIAGWLPVP